MKDIWSTLAVAVFMVSAVGLPSWAMYQGGSEKGYTSGYCAALGGTVLNSGACNVNGTVVEVQR